MGKTYPYAVKYNGKYYPANTPIEEKTEQSDKAKKADGKKKGDA